MNYRHAFHAGNFADVVKHAVLARILTYLHEKPAPFRVIDTHAGAGLYDLRSEEAERGGEWQRGIGAVMSASFSADIAALLKPYLDIVRAFNPHVAASPAHNPRGLRPYGASRPAETAAPRASIDYDMPEADESSALAHYPGSPLIARALLRPVDRLVACEIEPRTRAALINALRRDEQARVVDLDGWTALNAFVPPKERRGLVLVDPPFERRDDFDQLASGVAAAYRKWPGGIYMLWYPVKEPARAAMLARTMRALTDKMLRVEIEIAASEHGRGLTRAGLLILNPPWTLRAELNVLMPALAQRLGENGSGRFLLEA